MDRLMWLHFFSAPLQLLPEHGSPNPVALVGTDPRSHVHREKPRIVAWWIKQARDAMARGLPALALRIGRELHWVDCEPYHEVALELLTGAYEQLGRHAFAEIVRVHYRHRDLGSVDVLV